MRYALGLIVLVLIGGILLYFFWPEAVVTNAPPKNNTIVVFGDSLVEGVGSERGGGFVSMLSERLEIDIVNMGVGGNTTADGLARLPDVQKVDAGTVIVLLGGNDAIRRVPREETFQNLERIIRALQEDGAMVVLLGVRGGVLSDPYDEEYEALAERTGSIYVENVLKGLIGRSELMFDGIHPNDKGYAIIAERVAETLEPYFK